MKVGPENAGDSETREQTRGRDRADRHSVAEKFAPAQEEVRGAQDGRLAPELPHQLRQGGALPLGGGEFLAANQAEISRARPKVPSLQE